MSDVDAVSETFWRWAESYLAEPDVEVGTLMGNRCLRASGEFLATIHRSTGHLVVKLDSDRVSALVESGIGSNFAPAGRVFREWIAVPSDDPAVWDDLVGEALDISRRRD